MTQGANHEDLVMAAVIHPTAARNANRSWLILAWLGFLDVGGLMVLSGCNSNSIPTYPVSGSVTFKDGSPVTHGRVLFRPVDNPLNLTATGTIEEDGSFELTTTDEAEGSVAGDHEVMLVVVSDVDRDDPRYRRGAPRVIAKKYDDYTSSELRFTVTEQASKNHFNISVERPESDQDN